MTITTPKSAEARPCNTHRNEQIATVQSGAIRFTVGGEPGCRWASGIYPPNVPHSAEALEDSTAVETFSPPRDDWK